MESPNPQILPRGHVATTATDGRKLTIYYIREILVEDYINQPTAPATRYTPIDATATAAVSAETSRANFIKVRRIFAAELTVLRNFAAAYNRGEPDLNDVAPYRDTQPCEIIVVRASQHASTHTPTEPKHITVDVASEESWEEGSGYARNGFHVYSVDDNMGLGYRAYTRKKGLGGKGRFHQGKAKQQVEEAKSRNLQQYLERMIGESSDAELRQCAPKIGKTEGSATQVTWASVVRKD
ncbi:hypothetical protein E4U25_007576 [Claviceps purpurea]|nr:hypothetical protein E4U25_007576 [Claviceps purpurea]